jgi:putative transposase
MIKSNMKNYSVKLMARVLSVSTSGYYAWATKPPSLRAQRNIHLTDKIKSIFDDEKQRAGSRRITKRLQVEGEILSRHRVAKIMRTNGWRARAARKYKATTNSKHNLPVAPNLLEQCFEASRPNEKWVSDITYIWTEKGWLYLAVVMHYRWHCGGGKCQMVSSYILIVAANIVRMNIGS